MDQITDRDVGIETDHSAPSVAVAAMASFMSSTLTGCAGRVTAALRLLIDEVSGWISYPPDSVGTKASLDPGCRLSVVRTSTGMETWPLLVTVAEATTTS